MYYFVYYINTLALHWQEKSTLTNENKRIDNPRMKILKCIGAKAQDEKMRWITTKTTMGVIFHKILSCWLFPYRKKKSFRYTAKSVCRKSSSCRFSFSAREMPSFFRILVFFPFMESLNGTVSNTDFPCFKSHNPRKFWQTAMDWEWWRLCRSFISRKASDMSAADGRYQTHVEKYRTISSALLRLFSGWKKSWYKSTAIYINLLN